MASTETSGSGTFDENLQMIVDAVSALRDAIQVRDRIDESALTPSADLGALNGESGVVPIVSDMELADSEGSDVENTEETIDSATDEDGGTGELGALSVEQNDGIVRMEDTLADVNEVVENPTDLRYDDNVMLEWRGVVDGNISRVNDDIAYLKFTLEDLLAKIEGRDGGMGGNPNADVTPDNAYYNLLTRGGR